MRKQKMNEPTKMECPLCGTSMRKRQGRFGEFFGCAHFPKCTGSRDLSGRVSDTTSMVKHERSKIRRRKPGMMSRKALLGRLGRRGVLAVSATFLFRSK